MVTKMNDLTSTDSVTETQQQQQNDTSIITIALHPQPHRDNICDNNSTLPNMSPSSCDSDSVQACQMMIKKSLKLDLATNVNEIRSMDTGSGDDDSDMQFKSPTSPRSGKLY